MRPRPRTGPALRPARRGLGRIAPGRGGTGRFEGPCKTTRPSVTRSSESPSRRTRRSRHPMINGYSLAIRTSSDSPRGRRRQQSGPPTEPNPGTRSVRRPNPIPGPARRGRCAEQSHRSLPQRYRAASFARDGQPGPRSLRPEPIRPPGRCADRTQLRGCRRDGVGRRTKPPFTRSEVSCGFDRVMAG